MISAIRHYQRMGWLVLPEDEQWKLDQLLNLPQFESHIAFRQLPQDLEDMIRRIEADE